MSPFDYAKYMRERRAARRGSPADKEAQLANHLENHYGLSLKAFDALLERQGGRCASCARPPKPGKRLHVDHDHETGMVRALLCNACNIALGLLEENADFLWRLSDYADHCLRQRDWCRAHPVRFAIAQAYQQNPDRAYLRQELRAAMQRFNDLPVPAMAIKQVVEGRRGRALMKTLAQMAAEERATLPELAPVRAGAGHDAVYV